MLMPLAMLNLSDYAYEWGHKMRLAIVTRADENIRKMTQVTHPYLKQYANRCQADFIVFDHESPVKIHDGNPHYRILKAQELLTSNYDRILFLDSDMVITQHCPNIFEVVPDHLIGSIFEDKGSRAANRRRKIYQMQKRWGDVGWKEGYTNAGTFLVSKMHKGIFDSHNGKYWTEWGSADLHLSYMIHKLGFGVFELPYQWNHTTMFSQAWNGSPDRFKSYIIHYAGAGVFDPGVRNRLEQIQHDIEVVNGV